MVCEIRSDPESPRPQPQAVSGEGVEFLIYPNGDWCAPPLWVVRVGGHDGELRL